MKKIVCITKCFDGKKVWEQGEQKTISDNDAIPAYFKLLEDIKPVEPPKREDPMKPITLKFGEIPSPKGGMASGVGILKIGQMPTASSEAIRKEKELQENSEEKSVLQEIIKKRGRPRKI